VGAYIKAISYYLPEKVLTNEELSSHFPQYSAEEIYKRTGIKERHISEADELPSDMAVKAAEKLFSEHNIKRQEIDFLIFCTTLLDRQAPTTACILQDKLGLSKTIGAIDNPMGCSGYIYSLLMAKSLIASGAAHNILILAGETLTKSVHPEDHELVMLFGDGMTATLVGECENDSIGNFVLGTDGSGAKNLIIKGCNAREKADETWLQEYKDANGLSYGRLYMDGVEIVGFSIRSVPLMVNEVLAKENMAMADIDFFIFHQAGKFILDMLKKKMNIPAEKFCMNLENKGNSSSATIPLALYDSFKTGVIKKGSKVLLAGFGVGYSWGATIITIR
jgi:3-oxoacyl-[acyl-carrier-protein] synthase-3